MTDGQGWRLRWLLRSLIGLLIVVGVAAIAAAVRWAHSSGASSDDTNAEIDAFLAIASGCFGIAAFLGASLVAYLLGSQRGSHFIRTRDGTTDTTRDLTRTG